MAKESSLSTRIVAYLRALPRAHARKVHGSAMGTVGEPDIDAVVDGRSVKLEVKLPERRGTVTAAQHLALTRWHDAGALTGVVTSVDEVRALLAAYDLGGVTATDGEQGHALQVVERPAP